jgi:hypothetical protein
VTALDGSSRGGVRWVLVVTAGMATAALLARPVQAGSGVARSPGAGARRAVAPPALQKAERRAPLPAPAPASASASASKTLGRAKVGQKIGLVRPSAKLGRPMGRGGRGRLQRAAFVDMGSSDTSGAYLTLSAKSPATTFYVNNRLVGTGTVVRHRVDEGVHRIEAVGPGGARVSKWLAVTAGDDRQLSFIR